MQKICQMTTLWHATTSSLAERINSSGVIRPSLHITQETGEQIRGWNFPEPSGTYGDGVYLATTAEEAMYYADIRLKNERNDVVDPNDMYDENLEYLGLYRVKILDTANLVEVGSDEYKYQGEITKQSGSASFEFIRWVPRTRDADRWRSKNEEIQKDLSDK